MYCTLYHCTTPAPPTPTNITAQFTSASSVRVTWRWSSSGPAPDCFHTTTVTYRPEGGGESSLQLRNPEAAAATLTDLQCNTNYTIAVVATAGEYRREGVAFLPLQGILNVCGNTDLWSHDVYPFRSSQSLSSCTVPCLSTSDMGGSLPHTAVPHLLQGDVWGLC